MDIDLTSQVPYVSKKELIVKALNKIGYQHGEQVDIFRLTQAILEIINQPISVMLEEQQLDDCNF